MIPGWEVSGWAKKKKRETRTQGGETQRQKAQPTSGVGFSRLADRLLDDIGSDS